MHIIPTPAVLVLTAFASAALAQGTLADQALNESGAIATVPTVFKSALPITDSVPPSIVDTMPNPSIDTVPMPAVVAPVVPKPEAKKSATQTTDIDSRRGQRIAVLAGVTNWHWEEADSEREIVLVEGGMIPSARIEFSLLRGNKEFGAAIDASFGAIDYDGGLQDSEGEIVSELKSKTHYANTTIEGFVFLSNMSGSLPIEFGGRVGYHRWVRTIGGDKFEKPDPSYGYVETWSHFSVQPVVVVKHTFGNSVQMRLEGGLRIPMESEETVTQLPYGLDSLIKELTGKSSVSIKLKPKAKVAMRGQLQLKISHLLFELEYLGLDFGKSPNKVIAYIPTEFGDMPMGMAQPASFLDRLDARVGLEF